MHVLCVWASFMCQVVGWAHLNEQETRVPRWLLTRVTTVPVRSTVVREDDSDDRISKILAHVSCLDCHCHIACVLPHSFCPQLEHYSNKHHET